MPLGLTRFLRLGGNGDQSSRHMLNEPLIGLYFGLSVPAFGILLDEQFLSDW